MTKSVKWFGLITLLIVALAVPFPAWARVVYLENGNGVFEAGEVPFPVDPFAPYYDFVGDANAVPVATGAGPGAWNPTTICLTTQPSGNSLAPPLPFILPLPPDVSIVETQLFNLNFGALPPSIIKVTFAVRFSTNQLTFPPTAPIFGGSFTNFPNNLRGLDHVLVRLVTNAASYPLVMLDPTGPQPTQSPITQTKVTGWGFTWFSPGDTVNGVPYLSGTPTLTVTSTIYPSGGDAAKLKADGRAKLRFTINGEGIAYLKPSAVCVQTLKVDVTP